MTYAHHPGLACASLTRTLTLFTAQFKRAEKMYLFKVHYAMWKQ